MSTLAATLRLARPWNWQEELDLRLDLGFERLVLGAPLAERVESDVLRRLPRGAALAVELFLRQPDVSSGHRRRAVTLGDRDRATRDAALAEGLRVLELADRIEARAVIVPPAGLDDARLARGFLDPTRSVGIEPELLAVREAEARARLDAWLSVVEKLAGRADRYGSTLAIVPTNRPDELPLAPEVHRVAEELRGAPLALWLDTARWPVEFVEVTSIGAAPADGSAGEELPVVGVRVHDARGPAEGLSPGAGDLEWDLLTPSLRRYETWCLDLGSGASAEDWRAVREHLETRATPPDETAPGGLLGLS